MRKPRPTLYSLARRIRGWQVKCQEDYGVADPLHSENFDLFGSPLLIAEMQDIILHAESLCVEKGVLPEPEMESAGQDDEVC